MSTAKVYVIAFINSTTVGYLTESSTYDTYITGKYALLKAKLFISRFDANSAKAAMPKHLRDSFEVVTVKKALNSYKQLVNSQDNRHFLKLVEQIEMKVQTIKG